MGAAPRLTLPFPVKCTEFPFGNFVLPDKISPLSLFFNRLTLFDKNRGLSGQNTTESTPKAAAFL
ncbi:hypothetical protein EVA_10876 [gut metagenome]|uniref:Uncharacterized protein n=1 Tax=gut metagenome TaxID=749906 RepID=J9G1A4_9ZZZZ